jgi:hypothetical protein
MNVLEKPDILTNINTDLGIDIEASIITKANSYCPGILKPSMTSRPAKARK